MTVDCSVMSRFARTVMTTKALNRANSSQEISFDVELPKTAFITNYSMSVCLICNFQKRVCLFCFSSQRRKYKAVHLDREIDGVVYVGAVKEKEKAKKEYAKAVSSGRTAGLVQ